MQNGVLYKTFLGTFIRKIEGASEIPQNELLVTVDVVAFTRVSLKRQ